MQIQYCNTQCRREDVCKFNSVILSVGGRMCANSKL